MVFVDIFAVSPYPVRRCCAGGREREEGPQPHCSAFGAGEIAAGMVERDPSSYTDAENGLKACQPALYAVAVRPGTARFEKEGI